MTSQSDGHGLTADKDRPMNIGDSVPTPGHVPDRSPMMEQHEELRRSSVIALTGEQIRKMAADGQDPSRFSYRVWQQAVRQLLAHSAYTEAEEMFSLPGPNELYDPTPLDEMQRMGQEFDTHQPGETDGT